MKLNKYKFILLKVLGHKEGLDMMERADPLFLLVGLPTIPLGLILGKMIQWDEYLLTWWRKNAHKFALLKYIMPGFVFLFSLPSYCY